MVTLNGVDRIKKIFLISVIALFIGVNFTGSFYCISASKSQMLFFKGNILYVGGNGPGNYTSIQGAINDSNDGDTVFVFDESSPYIERIVIDKTIKLIGEDKNTTIIDAAGIDTVININSSGVIVTGFTVQNSSKSSGCGITLHSDNIVIKNNIVRNCYFAGILLDLCHNNKIIDNIVIDGKYEGVYVVGENNEITGNYISNLSGGIILEGAFHNTVSLNTITENMEGIGFWWFNRNNTIIRNNILNNDVGISIEMSTNNKILENNLIGNIKNAVFMKAAIMEICSMIEISIIFKDLWLIKNYRVIGRNKFDGNYWDEPRKLPYPIFGKKGVIFYYIEKNNAVVFDWHPAQEQYDI